ncbi:MAG: DNA/RNA non-specific endonuclease [Verrucomicrobia bacterium]|nr:DNA/RNA non-specific endonuclease [Verrucomicrobiota bacterium]MCH8510121.1 DNA/RNA non-specific endonuclease [Kiritimatiellia bacterium]
MRAIQERYAAVTQRQAVEQAWGASQTVSSSNPDLTIFTEAAAVTPRPPINWGNGVPASPPDGTFDTWTLQQRLEILEVAYTELTDLVGEYLNVDPQGFTGGSVHVAADAFTPDGDVDLADKKGWSYSKYDLPMKSGMNDPSDYHTQLYHMADLVSRLRCLSWPVPVYRRSMPIDHWWDLFNPFYSVYQGNEPFDYLYRYRPWQGSGNPNTTNHPEYIGLHNLKNNQVDPADDFSTATFVFKNAAYATEALAMMQNMVGLMDNWSTFMMHKNITVGNGQFNTAMLQIPALGMVVIENQGTHDYFLLAGGTFSAGGIRYFNDGTGLISGGIPGDLYMLEHITQQTRLTIEKNNHEIEAAQETVFIQGPEVAPTGGWITQAEAVASGVYQQDPLVYGRPEADLNIQLSPQTLVPDWNGLIQNTTPWTFIYKITGEDYPTPLPQELYHDLYRGPLNGYLPDHAQGYLTDDYLQAGFTEQDLETWKNLTYLAGVNTYSVFVPEFTELTQPLPGVKRTPLILGGDRPGLSPAGPDRYYSIDLGSGRYTRSHNARLVLVLRTDGDFDLVFVGDRTEYDTSESNETMRVYAGEALKTIVTHPGGGGILVHQSLARNLPDAMGAEGELIKVFEFQNHANPEVGNPYTLLTCTYYGPGGNITRHWGMDANRLYAGHDFDTSPLKWVMQTSDSVNNVYSGNIKRYEEETLASDSDFKWITHEHFGEMPLYLEQIQRSLVTGTPDRVWTAEYHENGLLKETSWGGPGSHESEISELGVLTSHTQGPFNNSASFAGNQLNRAYQYGSTTLSNSESVWSPAGALTHKTTVGSVEHETKTYLWVPGESGFEAGQIPWGVKRIEHLDGTETHVTDILTVDGRVHKSRTVVNGQTVGPKTVRTWNVLGMLKSEITTWEPEGLVLSSTVYENSRLGPTKITTTDGEATTFAWNAAGELEESSGPAGSWEVETRDTLGRPLTSKDSLRNVTHTLNYNGLSTTRTSSGGGGSHAWTATHNGFGEPVSGGFAGPQGQTGTAKWENGQFSSTGKNTLTHAEGKSSFNEQTLETVVQANTAAGFMSTVTSVTSDDPPVPIMVHGVPCLMVEAFALPPGTEEIDEEDNDARALSRTFIDGLGRVRRVQSPNPASASLEWLDTDYHYDTVNSQVPPQPTGQLSKITRPGQPDVLIEYDSLGRVYRRALDYNGNGTIDLGEDLVLQSEYGVEDGKWRETHFVVTGSGAQHKQLLRQTESSALDRYFSVRTGARAADEFEVVGVGPGALSLKLNNRVVFEHSHQQTVVADTSISESDPVSLFSLDRSALGVPLQLTHDQGPLSKTVTYNTHALPASSEGGGLNTTYAHSFAAEGDSIRSATHNGTLARQVEVNPSTQSAVAGGAGGLPHSLHEIWNADGSRRFERKAEGDKTTTWEVNPAGYVHQARFPDNFEIHYAWDSVGRLKEMNAGQGTLIWEYDEIKGNLKKGLVGSETRFEVTQSDLLGRPLELEDDSGIRSFFYDDEHWVLSGALWTDGLLEGHEWEIEADARGRPGTLTLREAGQFLHSATTLYRGNSDIPESHSVSFAGDTQTYSVHFSGPGGETDLAEYRVDGQTVFTWSRTRNANGQVTGISTSLGSEYDRNWTLDDLGRVQTLSRSGGTTTYGYHPGHGTLASESGPEGSRTFDYNARGELIGMTRDGQNLAVSAASNGSGAMVYRENIRSLTLNASAHSEATLEIFAGDPKTLVGSATGSFSLTLDEHNVPGILNESQPLRWMVRGQRPGTDYIGGMAIAELEGEHWLPPASEHIVYDVYGRRVQDGLRQYEWNAAGQLTAIENIPPGSVGIAGIMSMGDDPVPQPEPGLRVENTFDASNLRVRKQVLKDGNILRTHHISYSGNTPTGEIVTNAQGQPLYENQYTWGKNARISFIRHKPALGLPSILTPVYNELGLVEALVGILPFGDGEMEEVARYRYDEVTLLLKSEHGIYASAFSWLYGQSYYDRETQTYLLKDAFYCARTAQFLQRGGREVHGYGSSLIAERLNRGDVVFQWEAPRGLRFSVLGNHPPQTVVLPRRYAEGDPVLPFRKTTGQVQQIEHRTPLQSLGHHLANVLHGIEHEAEDAAHLVWELTPFAIANHKLHHEASLPEDLIAGMWTLARSKEARHLLVEKGKEGFHHMLEDEDAQEELAGRFLFMMFTGAVLRVAEEGAGVGKAVRAGARVGAEASLERVAGEVGALPQLGPANVRIRTGEFGELQSAFSKIEPGNLGQGTLTNQSSRNFAQRLGHVTDDAGHAVGQNLGGLGGVRSGNIFPQAPSVNRGAFNQFEQIIARHVASGDEVFVRVIPNYLPGATRPFEIVYQVRINGRTFSRTFPNP